ncbi:MAG: SDR family oxidoreductase [Planctomycetota bacterium]
MNVLVAGATGNTGSRVVAELLDRGHTPIAMVRESSDTSKLPSGVERRRGDLTDLPDDVCRGCDAVIFAAGSGSDTDEKMTDKVDHEGAKALIDLAAEAALDRFVMFSSAGAGSPDDADDDMRHYMQAKHDADEYLRASPLPYAILRPVALTDDDGQRQCAFGDDVIGDARAARGDVAAVLVEALESDTWLETTTLMQSKEPAEA